MLTREDLEVKERADRALRSGRAAEALPLYTSLLRKVTVFEGGIYETWMEGALAAYEALGRRREAGYVLMSLRRFGEAERRFDVDREPHEWALCASNQGRPREASGVLAHAGYTALAAMALESAGDWAGARPLWEKLLREDRLRTAPYETALVQFNLAQALRRLGQPDEARAALACTQRMLEELADDFETRGERETFDVSFPQVSRRRSRQNSRVRNFIIGSVARADEQQPTCLIFPLRFKNKIRCVAAFAFEFFGFDRRSDVSAD